jgi:hypothetical protein
VINPLRSENDAFKLLVAIAAVVIVIVLIRALS